ncbi:essential recombination function protein [Vibrio phage 1.211.B._10N.222.52.F11]|nr:essential recombination function protein [Vibrio phage 1.211.A._10N.222.52.F11]AUR95764.1 essential recombination function protein [Vibrio phage 1.211.B._10N.222.52.F11]
MSNGELITSDQQSSLPVMAQPHMRLIEIAVNNGADITQLEKLMDLQERYEANQAKKEFNAAMSQFQAMLPVIEKLGIVDYTTSKGRTFYQYAKIEDIAKAIQPALKETGLSYRFTQSQDNGIITVRCIVTHQSGHSEYSELVSSPDISGGKDQLKSIASAISYLRRYTLTGILGIVVGGEDDDGDSVQYDNQDQQKVVNCYPDEEFKKNFPAWSKKITDGKHTVDSLHQFLTKKNIILSQDQYSKLKKVGK